jgi:hypothetical protein
MHISASALAVLRPNILRPREWEENGAQRECLLRTGPPPHIKMGAWRNVYYCHCPRSAPSPLAPSCEYPWSPSARSDAAAPPTSGGAVGPALPGSLSSLKRASLTVFAAPPASTWVISSLLTEEVGTSTPPPAPGVPPPVPASRAADCALCARLIAGASGQARTRSVGTGQGGWQAPARELGAGAHPRLHCFGGRGGGAEHGPRRSGRRTLPVGAARRRGVKNQVPEACRGGAAVARRWRGAPAPPRSASTEHQERRGGSARSGSGRGHSRGPVGSHPILALGANPRRGSLERGSSWRSSA